MTTPAPPDQGAIDKPFTLSLWRAFRVSLATYRTEVAEVLLALWSCLWGGVVLWPWSDTFDAAPTAYAFMRFLPEWVWGALWLAKGLWQLWAAVAFVRGQLEHRDRASPELRRAARARWLADLVNLLLGVVMALGYCRELGPVNLWTAFHVGLALVAHWCWVRINGDVPASER